MARHPKRPLGSTTSPRSNSSTSCTATATFGDDPAIVGGFAKLRGRRIVAIAQQKGRDTKEKVHRNFGIVRPKAIARRSA